MNRRLLLLSLLFFALGCSTSHRPRVVLVFADVSASVKDFAVYREAWAKVIGAVRPGDRVILAHISDRTYTSFRPVLDYEISRFSYWRDNKLTHEAQLRQAKRTFGAKFDGSLARPRPKNTDIFGALIEAAKVFQGDGREPVLVLLSDMLEDSDSYDFEKLPITDSFTKRVIAEAKSNARLPDLGGATVYVAGASAGSTRKACDVEKFWIAYIKAANARLAPTNYGPALMNFGE